MRIWLGPLLAFVGVASYFALLLNFPSTRDLPWPSFLLLALAVVLSSAALWAALRARRRVVWAVLGDLVSVGLAAFFLFYIFVFTALPEIPGALAVGAPAPSVVLVDDHGGSVDVAALARDKLVLVFYRGHW
jgi:hypothetical protein